MTIPFCRKIGFHSADVKIICEIKVVIIFKLCISVDDINDIILFKLFLMLVFYFANVINEQRKQKFVH